MITSPSLLGIKFNEALVYAAEAHTLQRRKGTEVPYVSHILGVCSIVLEHGGSEIEAVSALLHDAVEDCGGLPRLADIRARFGPEVAELVAACSDSTSENPEEKEPWRDRKEAYVAHLSEASSSVALISAADKLHNARNIVADLSALGDVTWAKFKGGKDGTLWYYRAVLEKLRLKALPSLVTQLDRTIQDMSALAGK